MQILVFNDGKYIRTIHTGGNLLAPYMYLAEAWETLYVVERHKWVDHAMSSIDPELVHPRAKAYVLLMGL